MQPKTDKTTNVMPGPAIDPSTQIKNKLKAFAFIEGRPQPEPAADTSNKENASGPAAETSKAAEEVKQQDMPVPSKTLPPSTPAARLPLADLIGAAEEPSKRHTALAISPEERVIWQQGGNDVTPNTRPLRKRKRSRSSSPASASQNEASAFFPGDNEAFDLQNLHKSLKTPQADPAADLWSRYAVDTDSKTTPSAAKAPAFAHLIDKSSPHSSATAGSVSGLRRWASCGVEFPSATKPKRRRISHNPQEQKALNPKDAAAEPDKSEAKGSKVGRLVERIQETLARSAPAGSPQGPSSSSPLPENGRVGYTECVSPLQRLEPVIEQAETKSSPPTGSNADGSKIGVNASRKSPQSSSTEFGDPDIDMDMVEVIETQQRAFANNQPPVPERNDAIATIDVTIAAVGSDVEVPINSTSPKPPGGKRSDDFDDFVEDGDAFAADLQIVAAMYDTRPPVAETTQQPRAPDSMPLPTGNDNSEQQNAVDAADVAALANIIDLDSDEDFGGDDIDEEGLVAAEAVATQHFQATGGSSARVGRSPYVIL